MDKALNWGKCSTCYDKGYYLDFPNDNDWGIYDRFYCDCPVGKIRKQDEENPIEV